MTAKPLKKLFGVFVFIFAFSFLVVLVNLTLEPYYLSYTYPGSIGFFKLKERSEKAKIVVRAGNGELSGPKNLDHTHRCKIYFKRGVQMKNW